MDLETAQRRLVIIEEDRYIQNQIAQANARYVLFNTNTEAENLPAYNIDDSRLNLLALYYLNVGCNFAERDNINSAVPPIEKAATILEYVHSSENNRQSLSNYYILIAGLAYYLSFQYSKAFVIISKIEAKTVIGKMIGLFLRRSHYELLQYILELNFDEKYSDQYISRQEDEIEKQGLVYEITLSKALNLIVRYLYNGDETLINLAKKKLQLLLDFAKINEEPDIWWVIRLIILITNGLINSSLWPVLSRYFDTSEDPTKTYINSLTFNQTKRVQELFVTQVGAMPYILDHDQKGSIVTIPTSSGKTRIAELAILDVINSDPLGKILYIAPFRSLAHEVESSLGRVFSPLSVIVSQLYGGSLLNKMDEIVINESNVIVATPEKAKSIFRSDQQMLSSIQLVIIDEGHLLGLNERYILNEMFVEELRYFSDLYNGKFLLLSAVLPNASDLSEWLTGSEDNVFESKWKPSEERLGLLKWTGSRVDLNWKSNDTERQSYNTGFIISEELPKKSAKSRTKLYPSNKNEAVALTAYKLTETGPVLIYVGQQRSVFVMAKEVFRCIIDKKKLHDWKDQDNWSAFQLASIECYGEENDWLKYARHGILCHNAALNKDVRLPMEKLMQNDKPRIIISTSTLAQGVNIGVSSVIITSLYQSGKELSKTDFWNIAGRSGRAFIDTEGKILVSLDASHPPFPTKKAKLDWQKSMKYKEAIIENYFDKRKMNKAESGIFQLLLALKNISYASNTSFELLLDLIANNKLDVSNANIALIEKAFDLIDDTLLALQYYRSEDAEDFSWVEDFFNGSLACIQAKKSEFITSNEIIEILKARISGIITRVGNDRNVWLSVIKAGLPLRRTLSINEKLDDIVLLLQEYDYPTVEEYLVILTDIEQLLIEADIFEAPILDLIKSSDYGLIKKSWLLGQPYDDLSKLQNFEKVIDKIFNYEMPWILNGVAKKLRLIDEMICAEIVEELALLVENGLPSVSATKIYQSGIRSRKSAVELSSIVTLPDGQDTTFNYRKYILRNKKKLQAIVSSSTGQWLDLLEYNFKSQFMKMPNVDPIITTGIDESTVNKLIPMRYNGQIYLISEDLEISIKAHPTELDTAECLEGLYFQYYSDDNHWKLKSLNPYFE